MMKASLVFVALALAVASAHWTHDDELAREIGPPPGEEDIDVASLSDELISTQEKTVAFKTYRVTVGTRAGKGSSSQFKMSLMGCQTSDAGSCTADYVPAAHLRYYQGPFMTYALAAEVAAQFRPGMQPVVDKQRMCSGEDTVTKMPLVCSADMAKDMFPCEANGKDCKSAIAGSYVGYTQGATTTYQNNEAGTDTTSAGPIQRAQVELQDVGQITAVKIEEDVVFSSSNPCYTNGATKAQCSNPWGVGFVKVNTNDPKTGIGNGVFYVQPRSDLFVGVISVSGANDAVVDLPEWLEAGPPDASGGIPVGGVQNAILTKCVAQQCEEEMETKLGMAQMRDEFGNAYEAERAYALRM